MVQFTVIDHGLVFNFDSRLWGELCTHPLACQHDPQTLHVPGSTSQDWKLLIGILDVLQSVYHSIPSAPDFLIDVPLCNSFSMYLLCQQLCLGQMCRYIACSVERKLQTFNLAGITHASELEVIARWILHFDNFSNLSPLLKKNCFWVSNPQREEYIKLQKQIQVKSNQVVSVMMVGLWTLPFQILSFPDSVTCLYDHRTVLQTYDKFVKPSTFWNKWKSQTDNFFQNMELDKLDHVHMTGPLVLNCLLKTPSLNSNSSVVQIYVLKANVQQFMTVIQSLLKHGARPSQIQKSRGIVLFSVASFFVQVHFTWFSSLFHLSHATEFVPSTGIFLANNNACWLTPEFLFHHLIDPNQRPQTDVLPLSRTDHCHPDEMMKTAQDMAETLHDLGLLGVTRYHFDDKTVEFETSSNDLHALDRTVYCLNEIAKRLGWKMTNTNLDKIHMQTFFETKGRVRMLMTRTGQVSLASE
jgi:hypothetical protein